MSAIAYIYTQRCVFQRSAQTQIQSSWHSSLNDTRWQMNQQTRFQETLPSYGRSDQLSFAEFHWKLPSLDETRVNIADGTRTKTVLLPRGQLRDSFATMRRSFEHLRLFLTWSESRNCSIRTNGSWSSLRLKISQQSCHLPPLFTI